MRGWRRVAWTLRRWLTLKRFKTVVLVGNYKPYHGPRGRMIDVWGCNFAYRHGPMDRLFAMDPLREFQRRDPEWIDDVLARPAMPVTMLHHYPEIPHSRPFDLAAMRRQVRGEDYYINTVAYMAAEATRLGYGTIVFHCILMSAGSMEYFEQKPCLDGWAMFAEGLGIKVLRASVVGDDGAVVEESLIGKPWPWQSGLYGYVTQDNWATCAAMMASTMKGILKMPRVFREEAIGQNHTPTAEAAKAVDPKPEGKRMYYTEEL